MRTQAWPIPACLGAVVLALTAAGCSERANGLGPSRIAGAVAPAPQPPSALPAGTLAPEFANVIQASAGHLTPADLTSRGWTCFQPPVPNRIVCSHPNQGFPTVGNPPPEDRPATFTFFLFDGAGRWVGPEFLIRTDLYNGQVCEATGQPYVYVPFIGYYECIHTPGR